jgi:ribose transport system substrate-binding protein
MRSKFNVSVIALMSALLFASALSASAQDAKISHDFAWGKFDLSQRIADKIKARQPVKITVAAAATAIPRMSTEMRAGMERSCAEPRNGLVVDCSLIGPVNIDANLQLSQLETLLSSSSIDSQGIPVFTLNVDVEQSHRFAFWALDEEQAGKASGMATANLVKKKGLAVDTVALGSSTPDGAWARSRMKGFMVGYKNVFADAKFFNAADSALPTGNGFSVKEALASVTPFLTAHPEVNIFFHTDQAVEGVGKVIQNLGLQGKVFTTGFNVTGAILDSVKQGVTLATIDQNYAAQTYAATQQCIKFLTKGELPDSPVNHITPVVITAAGGEGQLDADTALKDLRSAR